MAWQDLPTNYTDASWSGLRKYMQIENEDGTVSFQDVTQYSSKDNSFFGSLDANAMNGAINTLMSDENGVLLKSVYDTNDDGVVDSAATAATATFADNGMYGYTHTKVGTEHRLMHAKDGTNIKFYATASFTAGDTFMVNGKVCTAKYVNGDSLGTNAFVQGAIVSCILSNTQLTFMGGAPEVTPIANGGTGATTAAAARTNLGVKAMQVVDSLPATLAANTIYFVY